MAQDNWSGIHIPIITPFKDDYSIDEDGLRRLVDYCIEEQKADGLVPCGTTGESPTLSPKSTTASSRLSLRPQLGVCQ